MDVFPADLHGRRWFKWLRLPVVLLVLWGASSWYAHYLAPAGPAEQVHTYRKDALQLLFLVLGVVFGAYQYLLARQGQLADRFSKAATLLGDVSGDKGVQRAMGALLALEQITRDSPKDRPHVRELVETYVRQQAIWSPVGDDLEYDPRRDPAVLSPSPRPDVRRAIAVLAATRGELGSERVFLDEVNLAGYDLRGFDLRQFSLQRSNLSRAQLDDADLRSANLERAWLCQASLLRANWEQANVSNADLMGARIDRGITKAKNLREAKGSMDLAPCIAVVGPANAGKTTLLHVLDEKLQQRLRAALVIKGNPDNTGRYQYRAPSLREELKDHYKGKFGEHTIDQICQTIECGRRNLEIALLDFGGKHNPENDRMLRLCTHYIVVSRLSDLEGALSWEQVAIQNGLLPLARMRSVGLKDSVAPQFGRSAAVIEGIFRHDVQPGDGVNDTVIDPLAEEIVAMSRVADLGPYVDLHAVERWKEDDIEDVHRQASKIRESARESAAGAGVVVFGGVAPIWGYLAALRCALEANPLARIFFLDPKLPQRLIEIPLARSDGPFPSGVLELRWNAQADHTRLEFIMTREDKWLPPTASQNLAHAPALGEIPEGHICLWGHGPTWLFGTYARWLIAAGVERLSTFDASMKKPVRVWP